MNNQNFSNPSKIKNHGEWQIRKINDLCLKVTSGSTPLRKREEYYKEGEILWFKTKELNKYLLYDSEEKITDLALEETSVKLFPAGTVLMAMYGDGKTITSLGILSKEATTNQACCAMIPNKEICDSDFLYFSLAKHKNDFLLIANGGAQRNLNCSLIKDFCIAAPPIRQQKMIGEVLSAFQKKIEINQKTNDTLQDIAKALFKSWFIDFDPVRAKAAKSPTGIANEISDLFPDSFEDSELGQIPKGWQIQKISQIINRLPVGKKFSNNTVNERGNIPVIDQSNNGIIGFHDEEPGINASMDHPLFTFANHTCAMRVMMHPFSVIQNVFPLEGKRISTLWLYLASLGKQKFSEYKGHYPDLIDKEIVVPSGHIDKYFHDIVLDLYRNIFIKEKESLLLIQLRDVLLPKLISGELEIPNAEKIIEEAGI